MIVTFISQCEKKALNKTRRVLDAFANRIGSNTWQTVITNEGLNAVKKLLRKTATKNTAVSCHWIRSRNRTELIWIVGKRDKFNQEGLVPVNTTKRDLLKSDSYNDWHYLPLIKALCAIAALFHDWGKATKLFQHKLKPTKNKTFKGDPIRHEWVSALLFNAYVMQIDSCSDEEWLKRLSDGDINEGDLKNKIKLAEEKPLANLPPIAQLVAWLIVSHHRLPLPSEVKCKSYRGEAKESLSSVLNLINKQWGYENRFDEDDYQKRLKDCFKFPNGLLSDSAQWLKEIKKWASRLLENKELAKNCIENDSYRLILNHSRLCLMLGDHFYSSQDANKSWKSNIDLYANTDRKSKELKQKLDEHLVGVEQAALNIAHLLPFFESEPPIAQDINSLKKPSPKAFHWQDIAVNKILKYRAEAKNTKPIKEGFFAVNMASTGCGKTFANTKIMRALSPDKKSLRFILALGLRTLTLQTGDEYRERIGLDNSELATLIGSKAVMELHQQAKLDQEIDSFENSGSLSEEVLLDEHLDFECALPEKRLSTVLTCDKDKQFLYAPVLSCTIDHMMAATETKRGGRYILPTLRLMSSDLVIDEIDDFSGDDLIAIARLIHLAGMLGRKVMISSATIPPDLAEGYFKAYRDGWKIYSQTRDASARIGCAWVDEFNTQVDGNNKAALEESIMKYRQSHNDFIQQRVKKLKQQPAKRKANITDCLPIIEYHKGQNHQQQNVVESKQQQYFNLIAQSVLQKHLQHYFADKQTQLNVSFGVVRVANISPCVALSQNLLEREWPKDTQVRVMAYHSQQVLLMRSEQEKHLDQVLKRKEKINEAPIALQNKIIRTHLDEIKKQDINAKNVLFILVATPVEEVGRDHDFDWAVIEPSSYRSIIQLAGRVKRHRDGEVKYPNIALMQYNLKGIKELPNPEPNDNTKVFNKPGFEILIKLKSHKLNDIINAQDIQQRLDAIPRIQKPQYMDVHFMRRINQAENLAELEHAATWLCLTNYKAKGPDTLQGFLVEHWHITALPQFLTPFRKSQKTTKVFLAFDVNKEESKFCEKNNEGYAVDREQILSIVRYKLSDLANSRLWIHRDFDASCALLSEQQEISQRIISLRYGEVNFPHSEKQQYIYNDQLGLLKKEN